MMISESRGFLVGLQLAVVSCSHLCNFASRHAQLGSPFDEFAVMQSFLDNLFAHARSHQT